MQTGGTWLREAPGWLFVAAGLTLCVVVVLVPAQRSLHDLGGQLARITQQGALGQDRIEAYERFLDRLRHRDPSLVRRLAAAELNLVPAGATPVLLSSTQRATVHDWIGRSVDVTTARASAPNGSWLSWLTDGSRRLWMLGFGVVVVFVGLLVDGRPRPAPRRFANPALSIPRWRPDQIHATTGVEWSGNGLDEDKDDEEDLDEVDEEEDEQDDDDELDESEEDDEDEDDDEDWEEEDEDDDEEEDEEEDEQEEQKT